jgi:hypothetical protein
MKALVVTNQFADYKLGEQITNPKDIEAILNSDHAGHVVVTNLLEMPEDKG